MDRDQWKAFLSSSTGRKLEARLWAATADTALRACRDEQNTVYAAARARGYEDAVQHLISLSKAAEPEPIEPQAETPPTADEELIERLSP